MHFCHANGCLEEAHPEMPLCKPHFQVLPEPHRKRLWAERPKGRCGACEPIDDDGLPRRTKDWNGLFNLGAMILAALEAPEYRPQPEWVDEGGFCWKGGFHDAMKTREMADKIIARFGLKAVA